MCKVCKRNLSPILFKTTNAAALFPRSLHFIKTTEIKASVEKIIEIVQQLFMKMIAPDSFLWHDFHILDRAFR